MKTTKTLLKSLVFGAFAALVVALAPVAHASNLADAQLRAAAAGAGVLHVDGGALGTVVNLSYSGSNTHAYVSVTASSATFYKDALEATPDTAIGGTSYGATGGTFDLTVSTMNTLGQLCDAINQAAAGYHCRLIGGLRNDSDVGGKFLPIVGGQTDLSAAGGYNVATASDTILTAGIIPPAGKQVILTWCEVKSAGTNLSVYGIPDTEANALDLYNGAVLDSNLVLSEPLTAGTAFDIPGSALASPFASFVTNPGTSWKSPPVGGTPDGKVVIRASNYGTENAAQTSADYINCSYQLR